MVLTKSTYSMIEGACINVLDFGAVGDGVTDDTAAIQSAINAAVDSAEQLTWLQNYSGSIDPKSVAVKVYLPAGEYLVSQTLISQGALYMEGDGDLASVIVQSPTFTGNEILSIGFTIGTVFTDFLWTWGGRLANFKIVGNGNTKTGIYTWRNHAYCMENVRVSQCSVGIWIEGGYTGLLTNCTVMKNTVGIRASLANSPPPIYDEPNDITFLRCTLYHNTTGYEFDNSTNLNIMGGIIQECTGAAINCTGLVRQLYIEGVYFELNNLSNLASAYIVGQIRLLTAISNFVNLGGKRFLDATSVTIATVNNNEVFTNGTVVYIPSNAVIQRLDYKNNSPFFSLTITDYLIDNQKAGFCPLPVYIDDFRSAAGLGFSEQLKRAFNGSIGTVMFTQNINLQWNVDFPCRITSVSEDVGIVSTTSGVVALTINSSDVKVEQIKIQAAGNANAISVGAAATVARVDISNCKLVANFPATGMVNISSTSSNCRLLQNTMIRQDAGGRSLTINGANCSSIANVVGGSTTGIYLNTSSSGCKIIPLGEAVTDVGSSNVVV